MFVNKLISITACYIYTIQILLIKGQEAHESFIQYKVPGQSFRSIFFEEDRNRIYLGGINSLYEFDSQVVSKPPRTITWYPVRNTQQTCLDVNPRSNAIKVLCENNVGVLLSLNETHLYTCGTMAYYPECRYINKEAFAWEGGIELGNSKTPYDPFVSTVSIIANKTLFTATRGSMQGNEGIISRSMNGITLKTQEGDKYWLNDPIFVGGHHMRSNDGEMHDKIMLFFREKAEEFQPYLYGMSSQPNKRNIVTRVGTVCVNDHGGTQWVLDRKFATYIKMNIVCNTASSTSDASFHYTHLESSFMLESSDGAVMFGIFTLPNDAIAGSAICAFDVNDIKSAMETNEVWNRVNDPSGVKSRYSKDPVSGPGKCVPETRNLSPARLTFGRLHPIKFGNIYPSYDKPYYQESGIRYHRIVVDKLSSLNNSLGADVTVLYLITVDGHLKRIVHNPRSKPNTWSLPDIKVGQLDHEECVLNMVIGRDHLYVLTNKTLIQIPLAMCDMYAGNCTACENARDPYCVFNGGACESVMSKSSDEIAEISNSKVPCPNDPPLPDTESIIEELQTNLTLMSSQLHDNMLQMAGLVDDRDSQANALSNCRRQAEFHNETIVQLVTHLAETVNTLQAVQMSHNDTQMQLQQCTSGKRWALGKAFDLALKLKNRPTQEEFDKETQKLQGEKQAAAQDLYKCQKDFNDINKLYRNCTMGERSVQIALIYANASCTREKDAIFVEMKQRVETMGRKVVEARTEMAVASSKKNATVNSANSKLEGCYNQVKTLTSRLSFLEKNAKNVTRVLESLRITRKKDSRTIRQLTHLRDTYGYQGQHICETGDWFLSNLTGKRYLLSRYRSNRNNARKYCEQLGGSLAIFHSSDELSYLENVIRAFKPTRHYWIGLTKYGNGTLYWDDGVEMQGMLNRLSLSQQKRIRKRWVYCVELNSHYRWTLIPCSRSRRALCQKENIQQNTNYSQRDRQVLQVTSNLQRSG